MVIAAPNKSRIRGKIVKITDELESGTRILEVKVEESFDVDELRNFTRSRIGDFIKIYVPIDDDEKWMENEDIDVSIFFQGDESGGTFFLAETQ